MENLLDVPVVPANEELRLERLEAYQIVNTPPEDPFDYIVNRAAQTFETPIALISLVDKYRVWYKATIGMNGLKEVPRNDSICSLVILQDTVTIFNDTLKEPCLLANPFVAGEFGLRFYAGAPIKTPDGFNLGAVCVLDKQPRTFSEADQQELEKLAAMVMHEIKQRLCC